MLLVGVILAALFIVVLAVTVVTRFNELDAAMEDALEVSLDIPNMFPFIGDYGQDNTKVDDFSRSIYVVSVTPVHADGSGGYIVTKSVNNVVAMSDELLTSAIGQVMETNEESGWIENGLLLYRTVQIHNSTRIAFADATPFVEDFKTIFINVVSIGVIVFVVFFFISNFLASIAFKPAEKSWEQQQHFLADVSHELKTPLTVILANNNILLSHDDTTIAEQRKWVESTQTEAEHMKKLVDELLFLAKSDAAKHEIPREPVDLSELAWSNMLQFEPVAFERGVLFDGSIQNQLVTVGDRTQLNQLIHILLDNAIKYAGENGQVDWSLEKYTIGKTKVQNYARLRVHNTGNPIPAEDLPHIFERFYRSDRARSAGSGYGLGLAIAKSICEVHGADILVESNAEKGTTFTVKFKI